MKILSTLLLSTFVAASGAALAAKDPERVTGKDRAAKAGTDREARFADRVRNPNAATPAMPYPGEGRAATPAVPAKKLTDDTTTTFSRMDRSTAATRGEATGRMNGGGAKK